MVRIGFGVGQLELRIQIRFVVSGCGLVGYDWSAVGNPEKGDFADSNVCCRE